MNALRKLTISQTTLKWIALISMLVDHIGVVFFPHLVIFRVFGRLAFPIFAFLLARGFVFGKSRKKHLIRLVVFGLIAAYPYYLVFNTFAPNILFTFALSYLLIWAVDGLNKSSFFHANAWDQFVKNFLIGLTILMAGLFSEIFACEYGFLGVWLPFVFWMFHTYKAEQFFFFSLLTILFCLLASYGGITIYSVLQIFSLLAIPLMAITNNTQSKRTWKWLFYIFYPLHLLVLFGISLIL